MLITKCTRIDVLCILALIVVIHAFYIVRREVRMTQMRSDIVQATTWCVVLSVWPAVWCRVAQWGTCGGGVTGSMKLGFAFPYAIALADVLIAQCSCEPAPHDRVVAPRAHVHLDPSIVMSLTFALAGMVGANADANHMRFFLTPALLVLCLVLPTPSRAIADAEVREGMETLQRAVLTCALSLVVCGVVYRRTM